MIIFLESATKLITGTFDFHGTSAFFQCLFLKKTLTLIPLRRFSQEMKKVNVNRAMKILTGTMKNGILPLTGETLNQLQLKHPEGKEASQEILLIDTPETIHLIKFKSVDTEKIQKTAVKTQGG